MAVDRQPDATVLRDAPLGDVEVAHDLHAADDAEHHAPLDRGGLDEHAVDAEAHAQLGAAGLEVDVRGALLDGLGDDLVDEPDDRRVVGGLAQVDDLAGALVLLLAEEVRGDDVVELRQARDEVEDVLAARDGRADLLAGEQRDVVDGEHVGGIGHRDEQRAVVEVVDRNRLVALGRRDRDEVGRRHVRLEDRQVEVVEAVALGDGAREAVGRQGALLDEHLLGHLAAAPSLLHRVRDALAVDEAEVDDDVGEEAGGAAGVARLGDAGRVHRVRRGRFQGNGFREHQAVQIRGAGGRSHHVQRCRQTGPDGEAQSALANQDLQAVDGFDATLRRLLDEQRSAFPVDEVHYGRVLDQPIGVQRQILEWAGRSVEPHARAIDQYVRCDRRRRRRAHRGPRARSGVRFQIATSAPARASAQTTARALPPAPSTSAERSGRSPSAAIRPGASVFSAAISPPAEKVSVFAAPISRALSLALGGQRERRLLVRDRHVRARESRRRTAPARCRRTPPGATGRRW